MPTKDEAAAHTHRRWPFVDGLVLSGARREPPRGPPPARLPAAARLQVTHSSENAKVAWNTELWGEGLGQHERARGFSFIKP